MGNIYGVAQPWLLPAVYTAGADVVCAAGTETTVVTSGAISTATPGDYYPFVNLIVTFTEGATPPTAITVAAKLGAGADFDSYLLPPNFLVASATFALNMFLIGVNSGSSWITPGSTVNLTLLAAGQPITFKAVGSRMIVALFRGPDA